MEGYTCSPMQNTLRALVNICRASKTKTKGSKTKWIHSALQVIEHRDTPVSLCDWTSITQEKLLLDWTTPQAVYVHVKLASPCIVPVKCGDFYAMLCFIEVHWSMSLHSSILAALPMSLDEACSLNLWPWFLLATWVIRYYYQHSQSSAWLSEYQINMYIRSHLLIIHV